MSKKDYILIATAINAEWRYRFDNAEAKAGILGVVHTLADALERENTKFDRQRFVEACLTA